MKTVLVIALAIGIAFLAAANLHRFGGHYILSNSDHAEVMVADPVAPPVRTVRVLFVGNSLTFINDLPAMVANLAASDPGNRVRLEVKAETYPDASLSFLLTGTGALAWAQAHHVDYVVLQPHSSWYEYQEGIETAFADVARWAGALRALNEKALLFEIWSDGAGANTYTNRSYSTYGSTPDEDFARANAETNDLGHRMGIGVVPVGTAFTLARHVAGAPELVGPDHHHASVAGTYLAALVFYRAFTGRNGAEASYRPWGMSKADAAMLAQVNAQ